MENVKVSFLSHGIALLVPALIPSISFFMVYDLEKLPYSTKDYIIDKKAKNRLIFFVKFFKIFF